ncbi:hypothetical protein LJ737_20620 [Hymenobacter sp. 15J16-1T3B]|uniref:hypothetical protein n=1 Tax=Hymenobacter sp. 15J16-1T3B TaxID=2886941 RepID=UPI001D0FBD9C|nr:hypothetical protein [Hymenobacter sp. 15J16-1T3B]MCC3159657.1 hypothetical protein [Hymenobacter sp. 15J16-1T3B]
MILLIFACLLYGGIAGAILVLGLISDLPVWKAVLSGLGWPALLWITGWHIIKDDLQR